MNSQPTAREILSLPRTPVTNRLPEAFSPCRYCGRTPNIYKRGEAYATVECSCPAENILIAGSSLDSQVRTWNQYNTPALP